MTKPKRVRHDKKIVFAGKDQVWYKDGELQIYKGNQWKILPNGTKLETYKCTWSALVGGDELEIYDSTRGTEIGTVEDGVNATYTFKDRDGTVLKTGKVRDGEIPEAPDDPTREPTAQYTYTFNGWNPTVGPINKNTEYVAQYTATVNEYTITFVDEDGTTELDEQTLEYGATPVYAGETPTKESTAQYTYTFSGWSPAIAPVTGNATYTAQYEATPRNYTVTIGVSPEGAGTVDTQQVTVAYGTEISSSDNVLTIGSNTITATAGSGYAFSSWGTLPATVTENLSITAKFTAEDEINELLDSFGKSTIDDLMTYSTTYLNGDIQTKIAVNMQTGTSKAIGIMAPNSGIAFVGNFSTFSGSWYEFTFILDGSNYVVNGTATLAGPTDQETYNALVLAQSLIKPSTGVQNVLLNRTTGTVDVPNSHVVKLVADVDGTTTPPTGVLKNFAMGTSSNYNCNFVLDDYQQVGVYGLTPIV